MRDGVVSLFETLTMLILFGVYLALSKYYEHSESSHHYIMETNHDFNNYDIYVTRRKESIPTDIKLYGTMNGQNGYLDHSPSPTKS